MVSDNLYAPYDNEQYYCTTKIYMYVYKGVIRIIYVWIQKQDRFKTTKIIRIVINVLDTWMYIISIIYLLFAIMGHLYF